MAAKDADDAVAALVDGMTVEQQIGQLFAVGFRGTRASPDLLALIQREHVGGVILFSRNVRSHAQTAALTQDLQAAAREAGHPYPLLIMTDQENGLVRRLGPDSPVFPGNMALGATDSTQLTAAVAQATARELAAHGINLNLAPVVDVNSNPANPVIGIRSFGDEPDQVTRLGAAAVLGYHAGGMLATLKHFPGHGDTAVDSHTGLPVIDADLDRLEAIELVPFRAGIRSGADAVMVAHVALPSLCAGERIPTTIAPEIVQGLLRERLGFDGLALSDCLEMDAIARTVGTARGAVLALAAGIDLVLVSHRIDRQRSAIAAVRAAVAGGELSARRVREAAERVLRVKCRLDTTPIVALADEEIAKHQALRDRAYAQAVTLVRDDAGLLPLRLDERDQLLVVECLGGATTKAADVPYRGALLVDALRQHHGRVSTLSLPSDASQSQVEEVLRAARRAACVIVVTLNVHQYLQQLPVLRRVVAVGTPVVGLAVCDPYDAAALPEIGTYLATYDYAEPPLQMAARILFGTMTPQGRLPVRLAPHA